MDTKGQSCAACGTLWRREGGGGEGERREEGERGWGLSLVVISHLFAS
jgi:hypothetical protein